MLTVLLTCLLMAGQEFVPPQDWTLTKVIGPADMTGKNILTYNNFGECYTDEACRKRIQSGNAVPNATRILLTRQIKPGETVTPPQGCQVGLEAKE